MRHLLVLLLCSGNSIKWEGIKSLLKSNEHRDPAELSAYTPEIRKELYMRLRGMAETDYLDKISGQHTLDNRMFIQ
jgi:hypothetical protein